MTEGAGIAPSSAGAVSGVDSGIAFRVGIGYDIHRLVPGRRLVLGGVTVPFGLGVAGHSDGDALAHAVTDALLGACALGDIGRHFPSSDPAYRDADSIGLLRAAVDLARRAGWRAHNLDATVVCERPRLAPFLHTMAESLAGALDLPPPAVNVKAKTNEGLDAVGRGEAVAAQAIMLIVAQAPEAGAPGSVVVAAAPPVDSGDAEEREGAGAPDAANDSR